MCPLRCPWARSWLAPGWCPTRTGSASARTTCARPRHRPAAEFTACVDISPPEPLSSDTQPAHADPSRAANHSGDDCVLRRGSPHSGRSVPMGCKPTHRPMTLIQLRDRGHVGVWHIPERVRFRVTIFSRICSPPPPRRSSQQHLKGSATSEGFRVMTGHPLDAPPETQCRKPQPGNTSAGSGSPATTSTTNRTTPPPARP
jgi:hypothetical protein